MKHTIHAGSSHVTLYRPRRPRSHARRYPNAADRRYYTGRLVDGILAVVTSFGFVSILYFLATMA